MTCINDKNRHLPYIEPTIRTIVGFLVTSVGLLLYFYPGESTLWLGMLFFISLNLFQSGFTRWCMMEKLLKRIGLRCELDEIRQLSERLHESSALQQGYIDTLNLLNEAVLELSPDGEILSFSDGWRRLVGEAMPVSETGRIPLTDYVKPDDRHILSDMLEHIASNGEHVLRIRFQLDKQATDEHWVEGQFMLDRHEETRVRIKGVLRDVTETYQRERHIQHMAMHDRLTGLPNRGLLESHMERALSHAKRHKFHVGVLFIDLDHFKQINDTYGHKCGDQMLVRVSEILVQKLRKSDTLARWGGDEFVALLPDLTDSTEGIRTVAINLMTALENALHEGGPTSGVTLSIGAASYPGDADNSEALLAQADKALYFAKSQGRNNVQIYSEINKSQRGKLYSHG